jgi:hypothetical protein
LPFACYFDGSIKGALNAQVYRVVGPPSPNVLRASSARGGAVMVGRLSHWRGLIVFGLAVVAIVVWVLTRDTTSIAQYSAARQQTWISPERIKYANEMTSRVEALEKELDEVLLGPARPKLRPNDPRQEQLSLLRQLRRDLRATLTKANQASNDEFEASKAKLDETVEAATAALKAAQERATAP